MKHSIVASPGIFKNHVRWLMMISNYYNQKLNDIGILRVGDTFAKKPVEKVDFILRNVYPDDRDCLNWLDFEWRYRQLLNEILYIEATITFLKKRTDDDPDHRMICLWSSPNNVLYGYLKFDPYLHDRTREEFLVYAARETHNIKRYVPQSNEKLLAINAFKLYNEVLDKETYDSMIGFLDIDNQYEQARIVHAAWYKLQERARKQAYKLMADCVYPDFPWQGQFVHFKISPERFSEPQNKIKWETIKQLILTTYKED